MLTTLRITDIINAMHFEHSQDTVKILRIIILQQQEFALIGSIKKDSDHHSCGLSLTTAKEA